MNIISCFADLSNIKCFCWVIRLVKTNPTYRIGWQQTHTAMKVNSIVADPKTKTVSWKKPKQLCWGTAPVTLYKGICTTKILIGESSCPSLYISKRWHVKFLTTNSTTEQSCHKWVAILFVSCDEHSWTWVIYTVYTYNHTQYTALQSVLHYSKCGFCPFVSHFEVCLLESRVSGQRMLL